MQYANGHTALFFDKIIASNESEVAIMKIARRCKNVTSIVSMDVGTVFKYADEYYMVTDKVDCIMGDYVRCVNLQTGELKSLLEGTVCEYFTETKLLIW